MNVLKEEELKRVEGGAIKIGLIVGIAAGISFLAGIIDGYLRPLKCN